MNEAYRERNVDYIAAMEEVIVRLTYEGRLLTAQSLYTFAGEAVAGSLAKVREFLHERGDAPQEDAFWDLRGRIGEWSTQHGLYGEASYLVALYLTRIAAEWRVAHDVHVLYELHQLKEAQRPSPPAEPEGTWDDPDDRCW
jgi:hypothetical protein